MSPADRLPPITPSPGSGGSDREPYLRPRIEPELEADSEPPFATMPEVTERELQADTLAFEQIGRRRPRNMGWLKLVVVLCVIGGGVYAGWHQWGADLVSPTGDDIPTVRAPDGPFKVRPEVPGGQEIPNRDKDVYGLLEKGKGDSPGKAKGKGENLLPRPEMPLPPPAPKSGQSAAEISEEGSPQMMIEPGEDDDTTEMVEAPEPPPATTKGTPAASAPTAATPAPVGATPTPEQVRAAAKPAAPPPPPAVKSEEQIAAAAPTPPIGAKAFKIQLSAVRTEAAAKTEWDKLKKSHASVLGRLTLNVEKADLGQKGIYYRIQAGPFADRAAADAACQELTKQKAACLVVRPEG
jgi:cell division septation protein DedD